MAKVVLLVLAVGLREVSVSIEDFFPPSPPFFFHYMIATISVCSTLLLLCLLQVLFMVCGTVHLRSVGDSMRGHVSLATAGCFFPTVDRALFSGFWIWGSVICTTLILSPEFLLELM